MPTNAGLRAVLDAPHDLDQRRAYARARDCDPSRKRIVEVEDALAAGPKRRADKLALERERETLLARNGVSWEPIVAKLAHTRRNGIYGVNDLGFDLGFVSHVGGHADRLTSFDELAQTSCHSLELSLVEAKHLQALLGSPLLPRLRRLHLRFMHTAKPEIVGELLSSAKLGPLEYLGLEGIAITPELAEAIGRIDSLGSLWLAASPGSGSLAGTAATSLCSLTSLRLLTLSGQDIDAKQLAKLLDAPFVPKLERLGLCEHKLGARGCKLLGAAGFEALAELDLSNSNVGQYGVEFAASPKLASLAELCLDGSKLGAKHLPAFLEKLDLPKLRVLRLAGLRLKEAGAEAIAASDAIERCGVTGLSIAGNAIGDDGAEALAAAEGLAGIRRLEINHNGIRADGIAALADSPLLAKLETLDIQSNKIQTKGAKALAGSVAAKTLREIDIDHNWIGSQGVAALFGNKGLRALEVARFGYDNNFEDAGLDALAGSDLRLRKLLVNNQGGPEALRRYLESPATEKLEQIEVYASVPAELADALATGELAPTLHTVYVGTTGLSAERVAALDHRFAFSVQRGKYPLSALGGD